jgi:hypothetical protein
MKKTNEPAAPETKTKRTRRTPEQIQADALEEIKRQSKALDHEVLKAEAGVAEAEQALAAAKESRSRFLAAVKGL